MPELGSGRREERLLLPRRRHPLPGPLSVATIWSRSAGDVDVNVTYWCECVVRGHELSSGGKPLAVSGVPFPKGATSRVKDTAHLHVPADINTGPGSAEDVMRLPAMC